MYIIIFLNFVAFFAFIVFCFDIFNRIFNKLMNYPLLCTILRVISILEVVGICVSIYFPLKVEDALSYSKSLTAPALIIMALTLLFMVVVKKKNLCLLYTSVIVLGLTAALFRILSSMQFQLF